MGCQAFGLQENLMAVFVGKAIDLVFHAGAIPWPNTFNFPGEHRTSVESRSDDVVRSLIGVGDPARHLGWVHISTAHETKNRHARFWIQAAWHSVTGLLLAF